MKKLDNFLLIALIAMGVFFSGCKDKEGAPGAQGPSGPSGPSGPAFSFKSGGFIQGTISGTRKDGTAFNYGFNNQYYFGQDSYSYNSNMNQYSFSLGRYPSSDPTGMGSIEYNFNLNNLGSATPSNNNFRFDFYKDLGNNQTFYFSTGYSLYNSTIIVSNFSYNQNTHIATGNFAINVNANDNSTGNTATISGSFQSNAFVQLVQRVRK